MTDFINKVISLGLIVFMCVLCPLNQDYQSDLAENKRLILNDIQTFLDKVADKKTITQRDIDQFCLDVNSHTLIVDAEIKVLRAVPEEGKTTYVCVYNLGDSKEAMSRALANGTKQALDDMVPGDLVRVTVKEITSSTARRVGYFVMGYDTGEYNTSMACYIGH